MTGTSGPPPHPLDEMWYVAGDRQAHGPYRGHDIKAMIERGSIGAQTAVAKVGAQQWTALVDVPAFARLLALRGAPATPPAAALAGAPQGVHYAGFWIRVLAYLIDWAVQFAVIMVASVVIGAVVGMAIGALRGAGSDATNAATAVVTLLVIIAEIAIIVAYQAIFVGGAWQATPGKRLCGIYIIRVDGKKVGHGLAIGRYLATLLSAMILYIGFIMVAFTEQKKGLHDIICDTRVIYGKT